LAIARALYEYETRIRELNSEQKEYEASSSQKQRLEELISIADECSQSITSYYRHKTRYQIERLGTVVNALFSRMHANRVVDHIDLGADEDFLRWFGGAGGERLDPQTEFSQGQRQDLAIAIFLARVHELGGTYFLDEPMMHLDDINRVALLDVFRAIAIECQSQMNLVITTANRNFARHMIEKFSRVQGGKVTRDETIPLLRVIELVGNARVGVVSNSVFPTAKSIAAA
jgi:exonuclease SbcC